MTYVTLTDDGAILGGFNSSEGAAIADAKAFATMNHMQVRMVCYGKAGEVLYTVHISKTGAVE